MRCCGGLLATLLRFVPYLGPFIAALFPMALAFAVDPGWSMLLWTIALVLGMELVSNNVVEPWLYGSSTGLSPVAIILAAIFWTLIWGPVGSDPRDAAHGLSRHAGALRATARLPGYPARQRARAHAAGAVLSAPARRQHGRSHRDGRSRGCSRATCWTSTIASACLHSAIADDARQGRLVHGRPPAGRRRAGVGGARARRARDRAGCGARVLCVAGRWELDAAAAAMLAHALNERANRCAAAFRRRR